MVSLNFQIDQFTLAFHTLSSYTIDHHCGNENCKSIQPFVQRANQIDRDTCERIEYTLCDRSFLLQYGPKRKSVADLMRGLDALVAKLKEDPLFVPILKETEQARSKLEEEWSANAQGSNKIMAELTGLPLEEHLDVYVIHPCFEHSLAKSKQSICCTYRQRYPNYNTQNLWYNIMSVLLEAEDTPSTKRRAVHAVLDLLFLEMKNRLSLSAPPAWPKGEGDYNHLLESWQLYLNQKGKKDIHQYIDTASKVLQQLPNSDK